RRSCATASASSTRSGCGAASGGRGPPAGGGGSRRGPGVPVSRGGGGRPPPPPGAKNARARGAPHPPPRRGGGAGAPPRSGRARRLVERAGDVDVVLTRSVKDALLLENELIKQHKPPFNVRLRDDKQYLALRLDPREPWPRPTPVRRFKRDGALYFGPYTSSV